MQPLHRVGDVRREALRREQVAAAELPLERGDVGAQRRRQPGEQLAIAGEADDGRRGEELLALLPARVRRRPARQRRPDDRPRDVEEAELGQHLRAVEALGERELLVGVADAVPPGEREVLDEERPLGVQDARLGDDELRALGELSAPEADDRRARLGVPRRVEHEGRAGRRVVEPRHVCRRRGVDEGAPVPARTGAEGRVRPAGPDEPVASTAEPRDRRREADLPPAGHPHEADERPDLGYARRERLLRAAAVARLEDGQPPAGEPGRRQPAQARAEALAADVDRERRAAEALRHDLAAVGDVERDRTGTLRACRHPERQVVDAGVGERPAPARAGEQERRQEAARPGEGGAAGRAEELLPPQVARRSERAVDPRGRRGARPRRRTCGRGLCRRACRQSERERSDRAREQRLHGVHGCSGCRSAVSPVRRRPTRTRPGAAARLEAACGTAARVGLPGARLTRRRAQRRPSRQQG